jgi:hypothetical protein
MNLAVHFTVPRAEPFAFPRRSLGVTARARSDPSIRPENACESYAAESSASAFTVFQFRIVIERSSFRVTKLASLLFPIPRGR